jgi:hypothetical protein
MSQSALAWVRAAEPVSLSGFILVHLQPKVFLAMFFMISYLISLELRIICSESLASNYAAVFSGGF